MSLKLYSSQSFQTTDTGLAVPFRVTASFSVKRGRKFATTRVNLTIYGTTMSDALSNANKVCEQIDRWSDGQLTGISVKQGHYINDEITPQEPLRSTHAMVMCEGEISKGKSFIRIPWLKPTVAPADLIAFFDNNDFMGELKLDNSKTIIEFAEANKYKHVTYKDTINSADNLAVSNETPDDDGAAGS